MTTEPTTTGKQPKATRVNTSPVPRLALSLRELAAAVGVSERTVRAWKAAGLLPAPGLCIGGVQRWSTATITQWLTERRES